MADRTFAGLSYDAVLQKYADTVAGVCVMRLQNWADAEDCFQNTFIKLFQKSPDFQDENHLKAWLIRVAINECHGYIAKNRRFLSLDSVDRESYEHASAVWHDNERDVSWALMRTAPKYREVLYLSFFEDMSADDIAVVMRKKRNYVYQIVFRAKKALKDELEKEGFVYD